jgi:hypothetical protein
MQLSFPCSCFISHIGVFFGLFLGPILALVVFNMVVFVMVIRVLLSHSIRKLEGQDKKKQAVGTVKTLISVISIMFMFGLQWLFGAFTIAAASEAFQWLFVIFSTLQGFFLAIFFCVLSQDAREEWLNFFSLGLRKRKKRGIITSHASQTTRQRNTGSTFVSSKHSTNTIKRNVLSSVAGDSVVEMTSKRDIFMALPTSIAPEGDTEFIISNGSTTDHHESKSEDADREKVDLANGHSTSSEKMAPSIEVPAHILERRFMLRYNPAVISSPLLERDSDTQDEEYGEIDEDSHMSSEGSTADGYDVSTAELAGDFTQVTDMTLLTNSDISDSEELTHL